MEFHQQQDTTAYKSWRDESGQYQVVWRSEYDGITVPSVFYASVRCRNFNGGDLWDFADRRGPYKTFKKAAEGCHRHQRAWLKFLKIMDGPYKGRAEKLRNLDRCILSTRPWWVLEQGGDKVWRELGCPLSAEKSICLSDPSSILRTSDEISVGSFATERCSSKLTPGPALTAGDQDESLRTPELCLKTAAKSPRSKRVKSVKAVNLAPKKRASSDTKKRLPTGNSDATAIAC